MTELTSILIKRVEAYAKTPPVGRSQAQHEYLNTQLNSNRERVEAAIEVLQGELNELNAAITLHNGSMI